MVIKGCRNRPRLQDGCPRKNEVRHGAVFGPFRLTSRTNAGSTPHGQRTDLCCRYDPAFPPSRPATFDSCCAKVSERLFDLAQKWHLRIDLESHSVCFRLNKYAAGSSNFYCMGSQGCHGNAARANAKYTARSRLFASIPGDLDEGLVQASIFVARTLTRLAGSVRWRRVRKTAPLGKAGSRRRRGDGE